MSTRTGALVTLALSTLLASLGTSVANVGLPTFSEAFHAPFAAVQWVVLAYLLTITALVVSVGRMGDLLGRRRLLLLGLMTAWARIFAGVHYPLDMTGAFMTALAAAVVAAMLVRPRRALRPGRFR